MADISELPEDGQLQWSDPLRRVIVNINTELEEGGGQALADHVNDTAAHGATSSPNPSTIVRRDIDGGTSFTAVALTDTTPTAGQAVRRDWVEAHVATATENLAPSGAYLHPASTEFPAEAADGDYFGLIVEG